MKRPYSLTRRLVVTVLLLEMALALSTAATTLLYDRRQRLRTFDIMLGGRADSLLGAVQDAEDAGDNVMLDSKALDLGGDDLWEVRYPSGRIVASSPHWVPAMEAGFDPNGGGRNFRLPGPWRQGQDYRGVLLHGVRQIDQGDSSPGISRPVIIFYASSLRPFTHSMAEAANFLLIANSLLMLLTGAVLFFVVPRGLKPLEELCGAAAAITPRSWEFRAPASALEVKELSVLAKALDSAMLRLQQSVRQQQTFVDDAAHELKTAVTVVKSSLQLLGSRPRSAGEYAAGLETCLADCERMEELVQRMLLLARFERFDTAAEGLPGAADLSCRVREACLQAETMAELRGVRLLVETSASALVPLPPEACDTLAANLIVNALQHTPHGGEVRVRVEVNAGAATLTVEDTGCGISPGELPRVFERFYRGDPSRSRRTGGTGLGLAICKAIADSRGGAIEIESEPGAGARVVVRLPLASPSDILQQSALDSSPRTESGTFA